MPAKITRAVRLIAVNEEVSPGQLSREQVDAYRAVESAAEMSIIQMSVLQRRNAALEAAGRIYANTNFR